MVTQGSILVPALIFSAVGFLVGILVMILAGDIRRRREEKHKDGSVMNELIVPEMPSLPESRFESIANLYREHRSGKLVTDIKGKVYLNHLSIPANQLAQLQEAARSWQTWLGIPSQPAPASEPGQTRMAAAVEPPPAPPAEAQPGGEASSEAPASSPSQLDDEIIPESVNIPAETPAAETPLAAPAAPAARTQTGPLGKPRQLSMVAQINEVLQEMLPETSYSGQIIVLGEEPSTGVVIWVGAQKYIGIESVPDPEIKGLIQSAIRRWEAQSGQG
jgi:hypothetical protein